VREKVISAIAQNGKVELSREDFLMLMKLAGAQVRDLTSYSVTLPAKRGPAPGTNVKRKGTKQKGGK